MPPPPPPPPPATRHDCPNRAAPGAGTYHTAGTGRPGPGQRCTGCHSTLTTHTGWYGVFVHSAHPSARPGGAAYPRQDALRLYQRQGAAQAYATADDQGRLVVRWVPAPAAT